jgi:diaminopimelate epimerase
MRVPFTKMQGAGNDFVVLDGTRAPLAGHAPTAAQVRHLADRRFGVGADQVLLVQPSATPGIHFRYRIWNANGEEVEHCGNGARCFLRYVHARGLTDAKRVKVKTLNNVLELVLEDDGLVTVDMNVPVFEHALVPFDGRGLRARREGGFERWPLALADGVVAEVAVLSMGNPHAVMRVDDVASAPVGQWGPLVEAHERFPQRVNAGFVQVLSRGEVRLRVHERGVGETLACGTGACAAVVAGVRLGWLDAGSPVRVHTRGGELRVRWGGGDHDAVFMTGPATSVFEGEIDL